MKKRINVEAVCEAYNSARMQNQGKQNSPEKVVEILKSSGISENLARRMISNSTLFERFSRKIEGKRGNFKSLRFSYNPIHVSFFKNWLYEKKSSSPIQKPANTTSLEEDCVKYLKEAGYQLRKCIGFDEDSFKKDYPELYQKYLRYESI